MAFERLGLGGVFTFDTRKAIQALEKAAIKLNRFGSTATGTGQKATTMGARISAAMTRVRTSTARAAVSMNKLSMGLRSAAMAMLPSTIVMGKAVAEASGFEKQMSAVKAITGASGAEFTKLTDKAEQMGIESVFSATQSGQAMEFMARAGASADEIVTGLSGVMAAAAADGIELASAADVVAQVTKGMGMQWSDANHIADVLATASASANTNIISLGESFKMGASSAKLLGLDVEETTAILSKISDAGLRGTLAGTSMMNMMNKLAKPTSIAANQLKQWNIQLTDEKTGKIRKIASIVDDVSKKLNGIKDAAKRAAIGTEIFGLRGVKAYNALQLAGEQSTLSLENELKKSSEIVDERTGEVIGRAEQMARTRLDNFRGSLILFLSSVQSLFIQTFGPLLKPLAESTKQFTGALNKVLFVLKELNKGVTDTTELEKKHGRTTTQVALGIRDAIDKVSEGWNWAQETIKRLAASMKDTFGGEGVRRIVKLIILAGLFAGALGPVMIVLGGIAFMITSVIIPIVSGLVGLLASLFSPLLIGVGILVAAYYALRRENESLGAFAKRAIMVIWHAMMSLWNDVLKPVGKWIMTVFPPAIEMIGESFRGVVDVVKGMMADLGEAFGSTASSISINWSAVGNFILAMIVTAIQVILGFVKIVLKAFRFIFYAIEQFLVTPFKEVWRLLANIFTGFKFLVTGQFIAGFKRIGAAIVDFVLSPIRLIMRMALKAAQIVGMKIPKGLDVFAKEGATGFFKLKEGAEAAEKPAMSVAEQVSDAKVKSKELSATQPELKADVNVENKLNIDMTNNLAVDGEEVAIATGKHKKSILERAGAKNKPWNQRIVSQSGISLVGSGA